MLSGNIKPFSSWLVMAVDSKWSKASDAAVRHHSRAAGCTCNLPYMQYRGTRSMTQFCMTSGFVSASTFPVAIIRFTLFLYSSAVSVGRECLISWALNLTHFRVCTSASYSSRWNKHNHNLRIRVQRQRERNVRDSNSPFVTSAPLCVLYVVC